GHSLGRPPGQTGRSAPTIMWRRTSRSAGTPGNNRELTTMSALESDLRRQLENVMIQARDVAEGAARSALQKRAVDVAEPFSHFGPKEKELRNRLRAPGRQVGDIRNADKTQAIDQLTQELSYESWHRMLFSRFLAENHLLMHPDGVAVSLEECEELARE